MKHLMACLLGAFIINIGAAYVYAQQDMREMYYNQWHQIIKDSKYIDVQNMFDTEHHLNNGYVETLNYILKNKYDMLDYVCNRMAEGKSRQLYYDVLLIDYIGGVCLFCGVDYEPFTNDSITMIKNVPTFQNEWKQGLYKNADKIVRQLSDNMMANNEKITMKSLSPILRFGIYAAPELIRQVKRNNSQYSYAGLLNIINLKEFRDYIQDKNGVKDKYLSKDSKIDAIIKWHKENKDADHLIGIATKIEAAISE
jgi:hypothetical protein